MILNDLFVDANDFKHEEGDLFPLDFDQCDQFCRKASSSNPEFSIENELFDPFISRAYSTNIDFCETMRFEHKDMFLENFPRKDNYFHRTRITSHEIVGFNISRPIFITPKKTNLLC